ncbi:DUF2924 domain-containing protein [Ruegeria sediminis]|uniref:DUF2924 domain-containing protein n=1 Tax=Ruegeria sediminis TaxID=2583820 RepID=A0ABY2WVC9_9RHOB|nr:DUF2924 domain-containing protein [Ruegeria sediminis]TMV06565.1 DUF2924 domain-containing protein [Ruegeria sediminis]
MDIATLHRLPREALLDSWRDLFGAPPPKGLSAPFLRRFIAFELQARQYGGLPKDFLTQLARQGRGAPRQPALKPGGRLLREWNGTTHVVDVREDGYLWNGQIWRSLSAIACEITGAHWSGPRFFGLNGKAGA